MFMLFPDFKCIEDIIVDFHDIPKLENDRKLKKLRTIKVQWCSECEHNQNVKPKGKG